MPGRGVPARVPKNTPDVSWTAPPEGFPIHVVPCPKAPPHALDLSTRRFRGPCGSKTRRPVPAFGSLRPKASRPTWFPARRPIPTLWTFPLPRFLIRVVPGPKAVPHIADRSARRLPDPRGARPEGPVSRFGPFRPKASRPARVPARRPVLPLWVLPPEGFANPADQDPKARLHVWIRPPEGFLIRVVPDPRARPHGPKSAPFVSRKQDKKPAKTTFSVDNSRTFAQIIHRPSTSFCGLIEAIPSQPRPLDQPRRDGTWERDESLGAGSAVSRSRFFGYRRNGFARHLGECRRPP